MATDAGMLNACNLLMRLRSPKICCAASEISSHFCGEMPLIRQSFSGSFSMICKVNSPNSATIRLASALPMPRMTPLAR